MLLTPSSICWAVTAPADVIVAVVVPSLTVMVRAATTVKELVPVRPDTLPVVQAAVLLIALIFVLVNLAVDMLSAIIDPRIRVER